MKRRRVALGLIAALAFPATAGAQAGPAGRAELARSGVVDLGAWLSEPGRAGFNLGSPPGLGRPPLLAGLYIGGWTLWNPDAAPEGAPFPGLPVAGPPLADADSLDIVAGGAVGVGGAHQSLVQLRPIPVATASGSPRATFALTNGDFGSDETSLSAERRNATSHLRIGVLAARRDIADPYGEAGRHRWDLAVGTRSGAHEWSGTFRQSGVAARLLSGEEEAARGASGRIGWAVTRGDERLDLGVSRQWDARESFGGTLGSISRRDAQQVGVDAAWTRRVGPSSAGIRLAWTRSRVAREFTFASRADEAWGTAWAERVGASDRLTFELGAGSPGGVSRLDFAPVLRWQTSRGRWNSEVWGQRLLQPIWHDLAFGEKAFLQSTWVVGTGTARRAARTSFALRAMAGRTHDRALAVHLPLEEQWLREGWLRDPNPWNFALFWGEAEWRPSFLELGTEWNGLARPPGPLDGHVDPAVTSRTYAGCAFRAFGGDLGVHLRVEGDYVGPRQTDEFPPRDLTAFVNANASVGLEIADARVTIRANNLENIRRDDVWIDPRTGLPARGLPREIRIGMVWLLKN